MNATASSAGPRDTPTSEPILRTEKLSRRYGGLKALTDVDFDVMPGRLHAVIGPNGAGKTTLFHVITGRVAPTSGRIWFRGEDITGWPQASVARLGMARSYQITTIFLNLTVFENLRIATQARTNHYRFWRPAESLKQVSQRAEAVLETIKLQAKRNVLARQLSHGEQRFLDVGIALATDPDLLLLDEPTAGMSPRETDETMHFIRDLGQQVPIVLVEHKMNVIMQISDYITVLHFGQVLTEGTPEEVRNNRRVQEVYLEGSI
ncbi:MAG: ABC transporter ATP-binding protein [Chloroflexi bacterium]|nr:ABC transporter ATP-binding protein [Chloroflexota bacterium]